MSLSNDEEILMPRSVIASLKLQIENQNEALTEKESEIEKLRAQIENLTPALLHVQKKMFGRSTEVTPANGQMSLFAEGNQLTQELVAGQEEITIDKHKRKARQPGVRADMIAGLPVEIVRCEVDEQEGCPECGSPLSAVGSKVVRSEVVYEPPVIKVIQYVQEVYKCTVCGQKDSENPSDVFVAAKVPQPLLPHSLVTASIMARIMYQKYDMGVPLKRQERVWYQMGFELHRSTMANWVIRCSEEWLIPLYDAMLEKILCCEVLHGDETRIQCNKEPGKKASSESYMWVIRTGRSEEFQGVLFHYSRTRSGKEARCLYEGFRGYLVTDAYAAYGTVEGITRALCWSHVRRYYVESIPLDSKKAEIKGSKGAEGRDWCDKLFKIEQEIKHLSPQEKLEKRQELSRPVLEAFWSWVEATNELYTANGSLTKALKYSLNQRKHLETFMEDGRIPLSNNDCESCIRPFATGRRAWLFADSQKGATANAVLYTLVETAKLNSLDVYQYLKYLFEVMPKTPYQSNPSFLDAYLPWSPKLPEICRIQERPQR